MTYNVFGGMLNLTQLETPLRNFGHASNFQQILLYFVPSCAFLTLQVRP